MVPQRAVESGTESKIESSVNMQDSDRSLGGAHLAELTETTESTHPLPHYHADDPATRKEQLPRMFYVISLSSVI